MMILFSAVLAGFATAVSASPYATSVLSYDMGTDYFPGFTDASTALGSAERFTGETTLGGAFAAGVTPFSPAFEGDELVSIGVGGHLALGFDSAITNSASHAFGIDLILFSNAGFSDASWIDADPNNDGSGLTGSNPVIFGAGGAATVQVSADGINWITATTTTLDLYPTLGYSDYTQAGATVPGLVESDFTKALDPTLFAADFADMNFQELVAFYDGSGGGIGIDIASTGLESASFVRLVNNSGERFEIDAIAVVPAPGTIAAFALVGVGIIRRMR